MMDHSAGQTPEPDAPASSNPEQLDLEPSGLEESVSTESVSTESVSTESVSTESVDAETSAPQAPTFEVPEVVRLASMDDLDSLASDLDSIDLTLAELDQPARSAAPTEHAFQR